MLPQLPLSGQIFAVVFAVAAGVLALWFDGRFGRLAPGSLKTIVLHSMIAFVVLSGANALFPAAAHGDAARRIAALMTILLPAIVYVFVTCIWVMRHLQGAMRTYGH